MKKLFYASIFISCMGLSFLVVQEQQGNTISPEASKIMKDLGPHVSKYAKKIERKIAGLKSNN